MVTINLCEFFYSLDTLGAAHELKSLEKVMRELNEMKTDIMDKEKKTSKMLSITSEFLSDYDSETRELLETLHQARDDQVYIHNKSKG